MKESRRREYKKIIHSRQWVALSRAYKAAHPLCEECLKRGIYDSPATEVHHVRPIGTGKTPEEMKALAFDKDNLEALCHDCHVAAHKRLRYGRKQRQGSIGASASNTASGSNDEGMTAFLEDFGL